MWQQEHTSLYGRETSEVILWHIYAHARIGEPKKSVNMSNFVEDMFLETCAKQLQLQKYMTSSKMD